MIWIGALFQLAMATTFMLVFRFPKFMIVIFGAVVVVGTLLSARAKARPVTPRAPQRPLSHPVLFRVISLAIALCLVAVLCCLLFGFVISINNWNGWHRYEGQPYHRSEFVVRQTYFQRGSKGAVDAYASGTVDGNREWMSLRPYLPTVPRSAVELDQRVPAGTSISIYLFPQMKGRSRVRVYGETPPADAYRRDAIHALNYGLIGLSVCAILIFFLSRFRQMCFAETDSAAQLMAQS